MNIFDIPRYKNDPSFFFFECYIRATLGYMTPEETPSLEELLLKSDGHTVRSTWQEKVRAILNLSDTIDVAIWDFWCRFKDEYYLNDDNTYDVIRFSQCFVDQYFAEDSRVDVWEGDALESAMERIRICKATK